MTCDVCEGPQGGAGVVKLDGERWWRGVRVRLERGSGSVAEREWWWGVCWRVACIRWRVGVALMCDWSGVWAVEVMG